MLLVPAGQALAAPTGNRLELFAAWQMMLWALAAMGLLNYLPTRHALAACLAACGQLGLLAPQLFVVVASDEPKWRVGGLIALLAACAAVGVRRPSSPDAASDLARLDQRWRNFRDAWGAFWRCACSSASIKRPRH